MTEQEWWSLSDPGTRLSKFPRPVSRRKDRLFAVGCCYHIWGLLVDQRSRNAVETAERFVDGEASQEELTAAHEAASLAVEDAEELETRDAALAAQSASDPNEQLGCLTSDLSMDASGYTVREANHALLLELMGPPFQDAAIDPAIMAWNGGAVMVVAQAIYNERAFDRMPVLADMLEEAGCTDVAILEHCRTSEAHVRGCWVLDALLAKV